MRTNTVRARLWLGVGVAAIAAVVATSASGASGGARITTIAGNGCCASSGDGGPATKAGLAGVNGVAVDGQGNVYLVENTGRRVRKVSRGGKITAFAGTGKCCYSGDGRAASARLTNPYGVAVDRQGSVYIADPGASRVLKVNRAGMMSTFAGNGIVGSTGDGGPATAARLHLPWGVAVDPRGNVYIAERNGRRVRKVSPDGTITTFAGKHDLITNHNGDGGPATEATFHIPWALAADGRGNVYIVDSFEPRIRKVSSDGTITTFAGGGRQPIKNGVSATSVALVSASGLAVDGQGNVYFSQESTNPGLVLKVSPGGTITRFAGGGKGRCCFFGDGGPATSAQLNNPRGLAADAKGNVYIGDNLNGRVRKVTVRP